MQESSLAKVHLLRQKEVDSLVDILGVEQFLLKPDILGLTDVDFVLSGSTPSVLELDLLDLREVVSVLGLTPFLVEQVLLVSKLFLGFSGVAFSLVELDLIGLTEVDCSFVETIPSLSKPDLRGLTGVALLLGLELLGQADVSLTDGLTPSLNSPGFLRVMGVGSVVVEVLVFRVVKSSTGPGFFGQRGILAVFSSFRQSFPNLSFLGLTV